MISLYPQAGDSTPTEGFEPLPAVAAEHRPRDRDRPWVMSNMIASADGATAIDGVSGPLGGPADFEMFLALRAMADAIVVGAATVREEDYQPPGVGSEAVREARAAAGQSARPLLAVVTSSLSLDPDQRLFADPDYRPLVATVEQAPADRRESLTAVADVVDFGAERVDLGLLLDELHRRGAGVVLSEGGPSLNGQLIADDLIDEWNLTISPILAAGGSKRPAQGSPLPHPAAPMSLARVWQADDLLFCRWVRA